MDIQELSKIIFSEKSAFKFLVRKVLQIKQVECCSGKDFYFLSQKRIKCKNCYRVFYSLKDTLFSKLRLPLTKVLLLLKLFEYSLTAKKAWKGIKT